MSDSHDNPILKEWRQLRTHPGYKLSASGDVLSTLREPEKILKPSPGRGGALQVTLIDKNGRASTKRVHRLVAEAFLPPPDDPAKTMVCHKNGDPTDNRVENLYWGTPFENAQDRIKHGRSAQKLTPEEVALIKQSTEVAPILAEQFGIHKSVIHAIRQKKIWLHTGGEPQQVGKGRPGSANGSAKLTESQIQEIRGSKLAQTKLAAMYGISQSAVSNIKRGAAWASVSGGTAVKGTAHVRKLNADIVRAIRADTRTQKEIAAAYGLAQATVGEIKRRQIWKHIE